MTLWLMRDVPCNRPLGPIDVWRAVHVWDV